MTKERAKTPSMILSGRASCSRRHHCHQLQVCGDVEPEGQYAPLGQGRLRPGEGQKEPGAQQEGTVMLPWQ